MGHAPRAVEPIGAGASVAPDMLREAKPMAESPKSAAVGVVLRRNYLSALENLAQSIGTMGPVATIGTVLPLLIYKSGNGTWLLFLGIMASFCLISTSINVFASRFASAGSLSAFAETGLGKGAGSLTGWSYIVAMAFVVISSGVSSAYYLSMVLTHFTRRPVEMPGSVLLTVLVILAAWWPAYRDIKLSTKIMLAVESLSVVAILFILGAAMFRSHHWVDRAQLTLDGASFPGIRLGFVLAFMTLAGFESTTTLGEEARTATHTLPRVMFLCIIPIGILFVGSIYCLTALSHSQNLALDQSDAPLDMIAQSIGLPTLGWLSSLGVAVSCFGCALGGFNAGARVIFSMARSRHLWRYFEGVHPVNGTPSRALALLGGLSLAVSCAMIGLGVRMSDAMDYLMQIASLGFLGGYLAVCAAAPAFLARKHKLGMGRLVIAAAAMAVIGAAFFLSLFPVPDGPWRYLPYIFVGLLVAGMMLSWRLQSGLPGAAEPSAVE
jgi:amino acid transporter